MAGKAVVGIANDHDLAARPDIFREQRGVESEFVMFAVDVQRRLLDAANVAKWPSPARRSGPVECWQSGPHELIAGLNGGFVPGGSACRRIVRAAA